MAKIAGFKVKNFKALRDITIGKLWNVNNVDALTPMTVVIGSNGTGKSTLFDAFGFLADWLKLGVEEACDSRGRGGFNRLRSKGVVGPIEFEIYYKQETNDLPITYELAIDVDKTNRPFVLRERLRQRRKGQKYGRPFSFLVLDSGKGVAWKGDKPGKEFAEDMEKLDVGHLIQSIQDGVDAEESRETEIVELEDIRKLSIVTLGSLKQHPRISAFRKFIEGWYLSYFTPNAARSLPLAGPQKHISVSGDNIGNVVQYMEREHPKEFKKILVRIAEKIPGIHKIETERTNDERLLLKFNDHAFTEPFYSQQMSDGTLKVFAYLLMLEDPEPPPFLCIEEPENGLFHKLLESLAVELRDHANNKKGGTQVFVTTHQPYLVDALDPNEVWILEKGEDGFSKIRRASDDPLVENMVAEGLPLGGLWYSNYLDAR
ncbi:MAG: AAA family ATPase [Planctomycetes bacterium]|nr:AAA family ATPase [Planctomycetota bacterium]